MALLQIQEPQVSETRNKEAAIGIDLGTTNSLVAAVVDGKPTILKLSGEKPLLPSVLAFSKEDPQQPLVGTAAKAQLGNDDYRVVSSIKRLMGRAASELPKLGGSLPFKIAPADEESQVIRVEVWGQAYTAVELSAFILRSLKARAEAVLGEKIGKAVITVPAYFDDAARLATKDAARLAGLEVLRLVNEPTAAALAYGLDAYGLNKGGDKSGEQLTAVYDLGGGTFDLSLLRFKQGVFQVVATGGDAALGGDDLDRAVAEHFLKRLGGGELSVAKAGELLAACRSLRESLSGRRIARVETSVAAMPTLTLGKKRLEALIAPIIAKTCAIAADVLEDAAIAPAEIKNVVPVGGATRTPLVRRRIADVFAAEPKTDLNPDEVVALGAALQAEALSGNSSGSLLLDITPLALGVETMGGIVSKIIDRNTPIPVAKAQEFTTYKDGQTALVIHVLQGEREMAAQCRSLARFELGGIPPLAAGMARIRITFTIDADGLLTVAAREATTGAQQRVEVKPSYGISHDKMRRMLEESIAYAKQDVGERLLAEAKVEATVLLNRLEAALAKDGGLCAAAELKAIAAAQASLRAALRKSEREAILNELEGLEKACAGFAEKRINKAVGEALKGRSVEELDA